MIARRKIKNARGTNASGAAIGDGMTDQDTRLDAKRDLPRQEGDEKEQGQSSIFELRDAAVAALPCRGKKKEEQFRTNVNRRTTYRIAAAVRPVSSGERTDYHNARTHVDFTVTLKSNIASQ